MMNNPNIEYQIGNAIFTVDRVFDATKDHCALITEAIVSKSKKDPRFDNADASCYNKNVSERFF